MCQQADFEGTKSSLGKSQPTSASSEPSSNRSGNLAHGAKATASGRLLETQAEASKEPGSDKLDEAINSTNSTAAQALSMASRQGDRLASALTPLPGALNEQIGNLASSAKDSIQDALQGGDNPSRSGSR